MKTVSPKVEKVKPEPQKDLFLVSLGDAARLLSVSPRTVYRLAAAGKLPLLKVGRSVRIRYDALVDFLNRAELRRA